MANKTVKIYSVQDNDEVYRCIFPNNEEKGLVFYSYNNNTPRFSSASFNDKCSEPSVDIAPLCNFDPSKTIKCKGSGVITLLVEDIRTEKVNILSDKKEIEYLLDVKHTPSSKNKAHGSILPNPQYKSKRHFKKIKERLAYIANQNGWTIEPN